MELKNRSIEDILSDQKLKEELKSDYLEELRGFEKEGNKDPYNGGYTCSELIPEVEAETPLGLQALSSYIKVAISLENGFKELEDFECDPL